jgi:stearoyl-CoA desaturase (delta-9 desaturase)
MAAIGLTIGYHRCLSHNELKLNPILEFFVLYIGLLCCARSPLTWAAMHRMHHAYSDTELDPHSPKHKGAITVLFSTFRVKSIPRKFIKSLYKNPRAMFLHKFMWIILLVTYLIAYLINPIVLLYLAALLPISFVSFGLINFFGHDENGPTNKWWINIFAPFEGNHYDHHT